MFWGPNRLPWRGRTPWPRRQRSPQRTETDSPYKEAQLPHSTAMPAPRLPSWSLQARRLSGALCREHQHYPVTSVPPSTHPALPCWDSTQHPRWEDAGQEAEHKCRVSFPWCGPSAPAHTARTTAPCSRRHRAWPQWGGRGGCRGHCAGQTTFCCPEPPSPLPGLTLASNCCPEGLC